MKAIIVVDHGSQRREANEMMRCVANLIQAMAGPAVLVRFAHMELAPPTIAEAFASCVTDGADEIVVFPTCFLPGGTSTTDIPRMVAAAAKEHPAIPFSVTEAFGVHESWPRWFSRAPALPDGR
jgi:Uncharacterized conserved protein